MVIRAGEGSYNRPMIRAAVYTRVSTSGQQDGTSPAEQRRILSELAERQGWEYQVFEETGSAGDGAAGLPILTEVLGLITLGGFQKLLVYHLDRLSRAGVGEGERIKAILSPLGCEVVTPGGRYDFATEGDDLRSDVEWLMAKQEHRRIFHRTYGGLEARAKEGNSRLGHTVPFGYRVIYAPDGKSSHVEIIQHEAATIRRAYELLFAGKGAGQAIASIMTREGYRGRKGKLCAPVVAYWLRNPRYAGMEFRRSDHSGWEKKRRKFATGTAQTMTPSSVWPEIVTVDEWARAQAILKNISDNRARPSLSVLGGILRCRSCGSSMQSFTHHPDLVMYYRCEARVHRKTCKEMPINQDEAHKAAYRWLVKYLTHGLPQPKQEPEEDQRGLEAALAEIRRQEDRLMDALLRGLLDDEQVARKNRQLKEEREAIQRRIKVAPKPVRQTRIDASVLDGIDLHGDGFRELVRSLILSVTLEPASFRVVNGGNGRRTRKTYRVIKSVTVYGDHFTATNR